MRRQLLVLALLMTATAASAQVYSWTDATGTVHYSQSAPAQGVKYRMITTTGSAEPITPTAAAQPDAGPQPDTDSSTATNSTADTPDRKEMCASLSKNLSALRGKQPVVMMKNGQPKVVDAEQRKQQTDSAQSQFEQYCKPGQS